ncbi:putative ABC transporter ATP-binding protein/MT1014 [Pigmentiphaga humi]|uniref:Putative ABC transporter ATP-binding protein/MT1014 n=1 Tax=Pigmentiphaga humi TaxID=2478468 RepID=A0A3P4AYZ2_9BURK|nr:ABC transporter ATP-binding protein [Pigmentiphaga humi]VCU69304.1 putative ABC transporter ATP-binding protein/MT1014 [Pigmentiphaga humi]
MPATESTAPWRISGGEPSIIAESLGKSFLTGNVRERILRNLSVSIIPGELTLISGPSGCGKSTLLAILSGMLRPDEGRVRVLGQDLGQLRLQELERFRLMHTGFVFQGFNLFPALTAQEQVMLPLRYIGMPAREADQHAWSALEEVGMAGRAGMRPASLSGGEQQRVAIARALAKQPDLLFADEPTSALDAGNGMKVIDILHRIAHRHGATVLCVSHDPRLIGHADRILTMEDGNILDDRRVDVPVAVYS